MSVFDGNLYLVEGLDGQVTGFSYRADEFNWSPSPVEPSCTSQLPQVQQAGFTNFQNGIAFGTSTGETEMYIGATESAGGGRGAVAIYGSGSCGELECASLQGTITEVPGERFQNVKDVAVDSSGNSEDWAKGDVLVAANSELVVKETKPTIVTRHFDVDVFVPHAKGVTEYKTAIEGSVTETEGIVTEATGPLAGRVENLAVSGVNGDVIIAIGPTVDVFRPEKNETYALERTLTPPGSAFKSVDAVTVDNGNGEIYVATQTAVYQFDEDGDFIGRFTGVPGEGEEPEHSFSSFSYEPVSIAVDPVSHRVFVGVFEGPLARGVVDVFGPDVTIPDVKNGPVSNLGLEEPKDLWKIRLNGEVRPDNSGEASCRFAWGKTKILGNTVPCISAVPNGSSFASVQAVLGSLQPDTTYYYRLEAGNTNGIDSGEESEDREFTTPGPAIGSGSVSEVSSSSARLEAGINPHSTPVASREQELQTVSNSGAEYYFQYSVESTEQCEVSPVSCVDVPLASARLASGSSTVRVTQRALGLQPDFTYHYRVVVIDEALPGEVIAFFGPDNVFATQGVKSSTLVLPDDRTWELVSPVDKRGGLIAPIGESGVIQAAGGGGAFTYLSSIPTESEPQGYGSLVQVYSTRESSGIWSSEDIALSHDAPVGPLVGDGHEFRFFSEDLSLGIAESLGPFSPPVSSSQLSESFPEPTARTPYLRHNSTCKTIDPMKCFAPVVTAASEGGDAPENTVIDAAPTEPVGSTAFVGATPDLLHVVVHSTTQLTQGPVIHHGNLYMWSADKPASEQLDLVSVLPTKESGEVEEAKLGDLKTPTPDGRNAISSDGSRVFFTANGPQGEHLYVRDTERGETVRLDSPEKSLTGASGDPLFQMASSDGSVAYFTDNLRLTANSGAESGHRDLYRCELPPVEEIGQEKMSCLLTDLTPIGSHNENADVQGAVLSSEEGHYVYFVANGVLAAGASPGDCGENISEAACNLYVWHDGSTKFIASLPDSDAPDWGAKGGLIGMTSRVSPDGRWFAFMSDRSLTGYDNRDVVSGMLDEEVFLYSFDSGKLVCVSCDPTGARPLGFEYRTREDDLATGDRVWPEDQWLASNIPGWTPYKTGLTLLQSRYLSDSGRVFFNSMDALSSQDTNGNEDVYEFEPNGVGNCGIASPFFVDSEEGCVALVSSGVAAGESAFLDASVTGSDVFFLTTGRLVNMDVDTAVDVYDAHECLDGSVCTAPEYGSTSSCESASACRQSASPQPSIYGSPASATFDGEGNVVESPAEPPTAKKVVLTRAQRLAKALKACKSVKSRSRRKSCERRARKAYGPIARRKSSKSTSRHSSYGNEVGRGR